MEIQPRAIVRPPPDEAQRTRNATVGLAVQLAIKRAIDVCLALIGIVLTAPLVGLAALLIRLDSPGPAVYTQLRTGRGGRPFVIYKLRTMHDGVPHLRNPDGSAFVGEDDPRITGIGAFLRQFSLDELPQLLNVLRGDMSIVGPRPEKVEYTAELPGWALEKLRLRPGCFSLSLIRGRNALSWRRRNELEVQYVRGFSLWLDLQILVLGLWTMFVSRTGTYSTTRRAADGTAERTANQEGSK